MTATTAQGFVGAPAAPTGVLEGSLAPAEDQAWRAYQRMQERVAQHLARELSDDCGLSDADYAVLTALADAPEGRMRALDLRLAVEWEKSRLSHQLRRMVERGLVERAPHESDARGFDVALTAEGRELAHQACCARVRSIQRHVLAHLDASQVAALATIADAVNAGLDVACRGPRVQ